MKLALLLLLVFSAVVFTGCIQNTVETVKPHAMQSTVEFTCGNNTLAQSRGYVILMGLGDHHKQGWDVEKQYMGADPKARFVVVYDQDETKHLPEISEKFLRDLDALLVVNPVEELVIFGSSAGGVTASYSIAKLNFSGSIALHTIASPLKGYGFSGAKENLLGSRSGYLRDIAIGFQPFNPPGENVKVYHHKTIRDTTLVDHYCEGFTFLCNAVEIQNNNLAGSKEFFYPQFDHDSIMPAVVKNVIKCYNPALVFPNETEEKIGSYCTGTEECRIFCHNSRGICNKYCQDNSNSSLCTALFT